MHELKAAEKKTKLTDNEEWEVMIERIKTTDAIHEISEETYWYFLEVLPPKWMDGCHFAFAEGVEPLQLFWQEKQDEFRTRLLSWEQTHRFCDATGVSKHYGSL